MALVTIGINGKRYDVACEDGQEAQLIRLGRYIDKRAGELVAAIGQVGDARLLVMVSLLVADELNDLKAEVEHLRNSNKGVAARLAAEDAMAASMEGLAQRVERLAQTLKQA